MNDESRVKSVQEIRYRLLLPKTVRLENYPKDISLGQVRGKFEEGNLICTPATPWPDMKAAREDTEGPLRLWASIIELECGIQPVRFDFVDANILMVAAIGGTIIEGTVKAGEASVSASFLVETEIKELPEPIIGSKASEEFQQLHKRYLLFLSGGEPLQAMAYYCLTAVINIVGGKREMVPKALGIHIDVLKMIGKLSSAKLDGEKTRKIKKSKVEPSQLSESERTWLLNAVQQLIIRVGIGKASKKLDMSDLPNV